jgi:hypothetical protein
MEQDNLLRIKCIVCVEVQYNMHKDYPYRHEIDSSVTPSGTHQYYTIILPSSLMEL